VLHVSDLMNGKARLKRLPAPVPGKLATAAA